MKIKNILYITIAALLLLACSDITDINENPNAPENIDNNPELLLAGICKDMADRLVDDAWNEGNLMAQYVAKNVFTSFDQFEWGTQESLWSDLYISARESQNLYTIAETTDNNSYKGVSLIIKSWAFQLLTDLYGDIPYTEAISGKTDEIFTPVYSSQLEVYNGIVADLEQANILLASSTSSISGDLFYDGDIEGWRRFGNSLHLRVLMRLSEVSSDINVGQSIATIVGNPSQYPLIDSNDNNATMTYTTSYPNVHPKSEASGLRIGSYDEYRMSTTIEKVLEAYDDPRQMTWFDPTPNSVEAGMPEYSGMQNGMVDGDAYAYNGGPANMSKFNTENFYFSANNIEAMLLMASEPNFIIAEAAIRYPEVAAVADAKTYYENGIRANFDYWGVTMPTDYLIRTSINNEYTVPVAFDNQIETVLTQKWIALFYNDYQGFLEYKRTGFPSLIAPGPDAQSSIYPSRFLYPEEEQALNASNYTIATTSQSGDDSYSYWTKVWWEN